LWRLGETTTPDKTWVVGAVIPFSDYKSVYLSEITGPFRISSLVIVGGTTLLSENSRV
jgi:hypothetical protein